MRIVCAVVLAALDFEDATVAMTFYGVTHDLVHSLLAQTVDFVDLHFLQ